MSKKKKCKGSNYESGAGCFGFLMSIGVLIYFIYSFIFSPGFVEESEKPMANMPTKRCDLALAESDGKIYAVGGFGERRQILGVLEVYDPKTNTWTTKADMPTKRRNLGAVTVNGKIYSIGGLEII
ncbi:kelch repeat-containing protein [Wukongibacter baidiensis]